MLTSQEGFRSIDQTFLELWLAGMLAAEMTLGLYFGVLQLLWMALARWFRPKDRSSARNGQMGEMLAGSVLSLRWAVIGMLGSAIAGGILLAFET